MPLSTGEWESGDSMGSRGSMGSMGSIGGYTLVNRLGSGGMGVVHLGRSSSGRHVAVKVIHAQYAQDEEFRARFRQEVAAARRVSGAFTAPVVDADPEAEQPWMATLYVPGRTLSDVVAEEGPLGGRKLRTLALGLVEALRDIHQAGVVHRDLKPSNVLMAEDGPRVIDFGISRAADNQALTVTGRLMGTPPFMSPEQFATPKDVTAASDVFSLGSLLVYAATGQGPFDAESPYMTGYQVMHEAPALDRVPEPLRGITERCLDKTPYARPGLAELQRLFETLPDTPATQATDWDTTPTPTWGTSPAQAWGTSPAQAWGTTSAPAVAQFPATTGRPTGRPTGHPTGHPMGRPTAPGDGRASRRHGDTTAPTGAGGGRGPGRRIRTVLIGVGATLAVTVAGLYGAYQLSNGLNNKDTSAPDTSDTSPTAALPTGWRPWQTNLKGPVKDSSAVNVDTVESGCVPDRSSTSARSSLYCAGTGFTVARIAAASGRVEWRFGSTSQAAERPLGVRNGLVFVYVQPNEDSVYSTQQLVAVDTGTGKRAWTSTIDAGNPAALFGGGLLAMSEDGKAFVALDAKTGKALWRTPAKSSAGTACSPAVLGGAPYGICVNADDPFKNPAGLLRLDPANGTARELGTLPLTAEPLGAVGGQPLFAVRQSEESQSNDGRDEPYKTLLRVNPATGTVTRVPLKGTPRGTPTAVDGAVYFVRPDGTVTAMSASKGTRIWTRSTQIENLSAPVLSKKYDDLYLVNRYGRLLALDRRSGAEQWSTDKLDDPGTSAEDRLPSVALVKDAIVAVAGDMAFSVRPDEPETRPSAPATDS